MRYLLDTHILLWWADEDPRLSRAQRRALAKSSPASPVLVSEISFWEIATLVERARIGLGRPVRDWLEDAAAPPLVERVGISPAVAQQLVHLPVTVHRDPADRILLATAKVYGATLVTQDRRLLDCGFVDVLG